MPNKLTLTKRSVSRLVPLLQDLLDVGARRYRDAGGYAEVGQEFNGWLNVQLLNAGVGDLWAGHVDVDHRLLEHQTVVTSVFTHTRGPDRMGILVDVSYLQPLTAATETAGNA